jgi:hypothetical protein
MIHALTLAWICERGSRSRAEFERARFRNESALGLRGLRAKPSASGGLHSPVLVERIREALDKPERTEGVRKIAARFGVDSGTVQRISCPFAAQASPRHETQRCRVMNAGRFSKRLN